MSKFVHPQPLCEGDKAIIISPSGHTESIYIDTAKSVLESWGLHVQVSPNAYAQCGRFGGTQSQRLSDLQSAMDDEDIRLILCSRGGYGIVQLLEYLDFRGIAKHPKWIAGYSDITALQMALMRNGISSMHSPMARHLAEHTDSDATGYLKELLFTGSWRYSIGSHELNHNGKTEGYLLGGNLAVLCSIVGTPYFKVPENGILFIEDIGECPYKIDRMMWQLKLSGILENLRALIVGQFTEYTEDPLMGATVYESIRNMVSGYGYPVVFDFPVGHTTNNYPLIEGAQINLEVKEESVIIESKS